MGRKNNGAPLKGRLGRWREYLEGFDYQVLGIKGTDNVLGDAVSRSITLHTAQHSVVLNAPIEQVEARSESTYVDRVCALQIVHDDRMLNLDYASCPEFATVYKELGESDIITMDTNNPLYRYFARVDEQLLFRLPDGSFPLCIPSTTLDTLGKPLRPILISECHDSPCMGHRGYHRTYAQIRKLFYWSSLRKDVKNYVNHCETCLRAKPNTQGDRGRLKPNEVPLGRMDSVSMDLIVGLPETRGYHNLLVMVERLSKKVFLLPFSTNATALQIAQELYDKVFSEHGIPLEIISDRDAKFTSAMWTSFFKILGTRLSLSYAYHQRFDGQTEVTNRTIEQIMRCYINFNQDNWLDLLPNVACAINNSTHPVLDMSPNEVFYGRTITRAVNLLTRHQDAPSSVQELTQRLADRSALAQDYLRLAMVNFTAAHYTKMKNATIDVRLQEGAYVMLDAHNLYLPGHKKRPSTKLTSRRIGPFRISKQLSDVSFELDLPLPWRPHCLFHARNLTYVPHSPLEAQAPPEVQLPDGEEVWVAERLDGFRFHYNRPQYFVIYEGYGVDDGMWQDRDNLLETCPQMVQDADVKYHYLQLASQTRPVPESRIPPSREESTVVRRPVGRPRKIPLPTSIAPEPSPSSREESTVDRRPVGRPRKVPLSTSVAPEPALRVPPPARKRVHFARRSGRLSSRSPTRTSSMPSR